MDTQVSTVVSDDASLEEMIADAKTATEPGEAVAGQVVHKGDEEAPAPIVVHSVESAGHVTLYNTKTGIPSRINRNMLPSKLALKNADGTSVWSTRQTVVPPKGTYLCLLHKDHPNRAHYDALGLAVCSKGDIPSPYEVTRHMRGRHRQEWETLEHERLEKEKQEDRQFQRDLLSGVRAPIASTEPAMPKDGGQWTTQPAEGSSKCECGFLAKNETGLKAHKRFKHKGE